MKSIISSAVIALLAISTAAQTNTTTGNITVPVVNSTVTNTTSTVSNATDNATAPITSVGDNSTDNGTASAGNGTAVDNGTAADNSTTGAGSTNGTDNSTDNGTIVDNNGTAADNGTEVIPGNGAGSGNTVVVIDPSTLISCQATNQTQCAFTLGSEYCCIQAGGNLNSDNSVFTQSFCYNQTLLNEQRSSSIEYGNDVTLTSFSCLAGNFIQLTGAAVIVGAATLLF